MPPLLSSDDCTVWKRLCTLSGCTGSSATTGGAYGGVCGRGRPPELPLSGRTPIPRLFPPKLWLPCLSKSAAPFALPGLLRDIETCRLGDRDAGGVPSSRGVPEGLVLGVLCMLAVGLPSRPHCDRFLLVRALQERSMIQGLSLKTMLSSHTVRTEMSSTWQDYKLLHCMHAGNCPPSTCRA